MSLNTYLRELVKQGCNSAARNNGNCKRLAAGQACIFQHDPESVEIARLRLEDNRRRARKYSDRSRRNSNASMTEFSDNGQDQDDDETDPNYVANENDPRLVNIVKSDNVDVFDLGAYSDDEADYQSIAMASFNRKLKYSAMQNSG